MNRRGFLKLFSAGMAATVAVASLPAALFRSEPPIRLFDGPITYRGVPLVFDKYCTANRLYFINPQHFVAWDTRTWQRVGIGERVH